MAIGKMTAVSLGVRLALTLAMIETTAPTTDGTAVRIIFLSMGFITYLSLVIGKFRLCV